MIIILEGVDGAGKSTLAGLLSRALNALVTHEGPPPNGRWLAGQAHEHYAGLLKRARMQDVAGVSTVFDRLWRSETIYGPRCRGGSGLTFTEALDLSHRNLQATAIEVQCRPDVETCVAAWLARKGQEYVGREDLVRGIWADYAKAPCDFVFDPGPSYSNFKEEYVRLLEYLLRRRA